MRRQSLKLIHIIEAKTSSRWSDGLKISGEDVVFSKLVKQPGSALQIKIMQDLNSFRFSVDLRGPEDTSFFGLKNCSITTQKRTTALTKVEGFTALLTSTAINHSAYRQVKAYHRWRGCRGDGYACLCSQYNPCIIWGTPP